jgi:NADP-dependent 3-hydroxy acid dehydrogenase YdfG
MVKSGSSGGHGRGQGTSDDVEETVLWCLDRPQHMNIQEREIFPLAQAGVGPSYLYKE